MWTGGWDSTFRVLDLVINKKIEVAPFYILDHNRKSTKMELKTMSRIREMIQEIDESASSKLKELVVVDMEEIPINASLTKSYKILASQSHLGGQYDWLARYCEYHSIGNLELCIHLDDTVEGFIKNDVKLIKENQDEYYVLNENPKQKELEVFSFYHYPLFNMTKLDMEAKAKESGFDHIMEATWFCHSPINNKACGMCNPCKYTREEGLGRRVPKPTIFMKMQKKLQGLKSKLKS